MNKQDCLNRAAAAKHAANLATARAAIYAQAFGGNDKLTQDALLEVDAANEASRKWEKVATWNHQTRAKALRDSALPTFIFQYK
jgi:hypothetical protein